MHVIPLVRSTVHLGICLSSTLSWSEHITRLINRVQFKVFTLKRLARRLGSESLVTRLFLSLVRPSLEYAAPAWDSCSKHDAMSLERVRTALGRPSYSSYKQAIMPQHGHSPENRLAKLSLASPTSKIASTLGPSSRQRSPESERPSIPCIHPHSVLSPKPIASCCSSRPYCPSSKVFSSSYCDAFQFLAILRCLLFFYKFIQTRYRPSLC